MSGVVGDCAVVKLGVGEMVSCPGESLDSAEGESDGDWMALVGLIIRSGGREPMGMGYKVG